MSQLLLINPRKRRGATHRTAAQKAATKRMVAANRARRSGHKRSVVHHYAPNPAPARRRRARHSLAGVARTVRRYKRNPISSGGSGIKHMMVTSLQGAAGGLVVNTAMNWLPLPAAMKVGKMRFVAQGAVAVLLGVAGRKVLPRRVAENMAVGSLTITMHDALKEIVGSIVPGMRLGEVGYYSPGYPVDAPAQLGEYVGDTGLGEWNHTGITSAENVGMSL